VAAQIPNLTARQTELDCAMYDLDGRRQVVDRSLASLDYLQRLLVDDGHPADDEPSLIRSGIAGTRPGWLCRRISLPNGPEFSVMLDTTVYDTVAEYLANGISIDQIYIDLMLQLCPPGQLVLDLGAHVGTFSLAAAAAGCLAVAVEAAPHNVELLRASVARNGFHELRVVHAAASDQPGTLQFWPRGPWGRVATSDGAEPDTDTPAITVPALPVQDLLIELGIGPAFVKLDVEGSELRAIDGMRDLLSGPAAPPLLYESNGHTLAQYGATPEELIAKVDALGYTSYLVTGDHRLVRTKAGEMQPQTLADYLALKRAPAGLNGWRVEQGMGPGERISRIVDDLVHVNPHHRAYMAHALATCEDGSVTHPDVAQALAALADDPEDFVREAAAWTTDRPLTGAGAGAHAPSDRR
jgi:FkbM family methyltransferase